VGADAIEKVGGFLREAIGGSLWVGVLPKSRVVRFFRVRGSLKDCLGGVRAEKVKRVSGPPTSNSLRIPLRQERYNLLLFALARPLFVFEVEGGFLRDLRRLLFRSLPCFFFPFRLIRTYLGLLEQGSPGMPSGGCTLGGRSLRFVCRREFGREERRRAKREERGHLVEESSELF